MRRRPLPTFSLLILPLLACPPQPQSPCPFDDPPMAGVFLPESSCPEGYFHWVDPTCGPSHPDGGVRCGPRYYDGRCYRRCTSDSDCDDPQPFCSLLGLYAGGDAKCNRTVRICRCKRADDCGGVERP